MNHALFNACGDGGEVGTRGCRALSKHDGATFVHAGEDAIGHEDVEVDKASKRPGEALHEGDGARLAAPASAWLLPARDFLHEDAALRGQRIRAEREHAADFVRCCQHPLAHGHVGQEVIHQVRRGVAHPPSRARRARSAAFARERDDDFLTALRAHDAQKAVRQDPATQIPAKLLFDVARERFAALFMHGPEERFEVLTHDAMEHRVLRLAARVASRRVGCCRGRRRGNHDAASSRDAGQT